MVNRIIETKRGNRTTLYLLACCTAILAMVFQGGHGSALAEPLTPEGWYRLRTNSVPYRPQSMTIDTTGGLLLTAVGEYDPGVWYRPPGASEDPSFQYLTNDQGNNFLGAAYTPPIVKPQLDAMVLYAARDQAANTWYALENRKVLCERADQSWLTFTMPDSSSVQPGVNTIGVDSATRIRLINNGDGSQDKLFIAARGVVRVNDAFTVVETRQVYEPYNNYFIRDALIDSQGRYWVTSEMGVEKGTSLVNTAYVKDLFPADPSAAKGTMITRIEEDANGNIWFGSNSYSGDGIYCYTASGQWIKYANGLVNEIGKKVHDIAAGSDGSVWFGAVYSGDGGILRYEPANGGQWTRYTQADLGLESGEIPSLVVDGAGLWFVTAYNPSIPGNGTGVHFLTFTEQGQPDVTHYTYRDNSTTLASLRFSSIAADRSGGVWFPSYDAPSIARLKADGSWQQFLQAGTQGLGSFGFAGVAADTRNKVYFAPQNSPPLAYDVKSEQWLDLPAPPFSEFYYYGVYVDQQNGKWFHGAFGVYYLNPANTVWTRYSQAEVPQIPDNYVEGVLVDEAGNAWFMCRTGIALRKKDPAGGAPSWFQFTGSNGSGYTGGYRVYQDDNGQVWNAAKQRFDPQGNTWSSVADTEDFDHRKLRFLNGMVPVDMDLTGALLPVMALDERNMSVDSRGTIYFTGGLGNVSAGIVAYTPVLPSCTPPASIAVPAKSPDGNFTVTWDASTTPDVSYVLQEASNIDFSPVLRTISNGTALSYNVTGRAKSKTYYYRVKAMRNGYRTSAWRSGTNGCAVPGALAAAPAATIKVPAADPDGNYPVSWGASTTTGVVHYVLEEATDLGFTTGLRTIPCGTALRYGVTGRAKSKTYYYRVRAMKNGYRDSTWKKGTNGCAVPGTLAVAPAAIITVPAADSDGNFSVSWGASPTAGLIHYVLEEATDSGFTTGLRVIPCGTALRYKVYGRATSTTYYYRVRAMKSGYRDSTWKKGARGCVVTLAVARTPSANEGRDNA